MYEVDNVALKVEMAKKQIDTIEELSRITGVNRNTLSGVLEGKSYPSSMVMTKIARALDMPAEKAGRIFFKKKLA